MRRVCALPSKPPNPAIRLLQRPLTVVAEWRVSEVVCQASRVDDVLRHSERGGELAPDLGNLERVRQPISGKVDMRRSG